MTVDTRARLTLTTVALIVGGVVGGLSLSFSAVPDPWEDEAATISATARSWRELVLLLGNIDAVHGLYYAVMKIWFGFVGTSVFTLRCVSAVAVGIACTLTMVLADRLAGRRVAIVSGIIFACLPRIAWAAVEGRPYALVMVAALGMTLLLVRALDEGRAHRRRLAWFWYGFAILVAVVLNIYLALVVVVHGAILVAAARNGRSKALPWLITAGSAGVLLIPFALIVIGQAGQVHWIPELSVRTMPQIVVDTWFRAIWPIRGLAVLTLVAVPVGWLLLLFGVRSAVNRDGKPSRGFPSDGRHSVHLHSGRALVFLAFGPMVLLLTATALGKPLFAPYYLTMSAPFVAILIAVGVAGLAGRRRVMALTVVVAVAIPSFVAIRLPHSHHEIYWSDAIRLVNDQRLASAGSDAIVFASVAELPSKTASLLTIPYPHAFEGMRDLGGVGSRRSEGNLFDRNGDLATLIPSRVGSIDNVWILGATEGDKRADEARRVLEASGFSVDTSTDLGPVRVTELRRSR